MNNKIKFTLCLTCVSFIALIICGISFLSSPAAGWYQNINHLIVNSEEVFAVRQAYSNDITDEDPINYTETLRVLQSETTELKEVSIIPGDVVYYSIIFKLREEEYLSNKELIVSLNGLASYTETKTSSSGDFVSFLNNCCIEENSCSVSILHTDGELDSDGAMSFNPVQYIVDGSDCKMTTTASGNNLTHFDNTTTPSFTNTGVDKLSRNNAFDVSLNVILPTVKDYPTIAIEENGKNANYIYFVIYFPIWYQDTEELQNNELDCMIMITGCAITSVKNKKNE